MFQKETRTISQQLSSSSINDYELEAEIGHGSSGTCYRGVHKKNKKVYAIKKITINNLKIVLAHEKTK